MDNEKSTNKFPEKSLNVHVRIKTANESCDEPYVERDLYDFDNEK